MTVHLVSNQKIAETSSKGNQEKWQDGNIWYKLDQFGYEALAEVFTSQLLECSDFPENTDNPPNWDSGCSQRAALENRKRDFLHEVSLLFHRRRFGHRERNRNSRKSETTYGQFDDLLPEIRRRKASS